MALRVKFPAVAIAAAMLVLPAILPMPARADAAHPITLNRGNDAEPDSLDPQKAEAEVTSWILDDLFEGLVTIGPDESIRPGAAVSWTISSDGLTYTFKLRSDARWSNGDPVTADDFVYTFRRAVDPSLASDYAYITYPIKNARAIVEGKIKDISQVGARAIDPLTFEVTLEEPTAYFLPLMAHAHFQPVHQPNVERFGTKFTRAGNLVSNGAYMLQEWTPQSRVLLVKNPMFHDADHVQIDRVIYYPIESPTEQINRFRAGEIDITDTIPINQVDWVRKNLSDSVIIRPSLYYVYYGFNMTKPPFGDNPRLRQALTMVVDRDLIAQKVLRGVDKPAYGWVPPGIPGYAGQVPGWSSWPMEKRIAVAKQLYREAGYGPGHDLNVQLIYPTSEDVREISLTLVRMWHDTLGVNTSLANEEFKVLLATRHEKKTTQVFEDAWIGDYPDPVTFLGLLESNSGENDTGYSNPEFDHLLAEARVSVQPEQRMGLLEQAERVAITDNAAIPLYFARQFRLVAPYVHGYAPSMCEYIYSKDITIDRHQTLAMNR